MEGESGELGSPSDTKWLTFAELADELCPQYMAMGMTYDEFWHGNYAKLAYYRKALELQRTQMNNEAWWQGAYVYDALCMVSPALRAFGGGKPAPYHKEPYSMKQSEAKKDSDAEAKAGAAKFYAFAANFNKKFEKNERP